MSEDIRLVWDESRGTHFEAVRDLKVGTLVLAPTCVEEALSEASEYCYICKAKVSDEATICSMCTGVSICCACDSRSFWMRHKLECRAVNALDMEIDAGGITETGRVAIENNARANLLLSLRWTIHRSDCLYGEDKWFNQMWSNGYIPEKLLTHESERTIQEVTMLSQTAAFLHKLAVKHAEAKASVKEIMQFLQIIRCNGHGIMDPLRQESIGIGFYPAGSCFNHSCYPNVDFLPNANGQLQFVTIRDVKAGEEMTITYTDIITQSTSERIESLKRDYFFLCKCKRCVSNLSYDEILQGGDQAVLDRVSQLQLAAENSLALEDALHIFKLSLKEQGLPEFHSLKWKSYHGVLIHSEALGKWKSLLSASIAMLRFFDELEKSVEHKALPVAQTGLYLKIAWAAAKLNGDYQAIGHDALISAIRSLEPFGVKLSGLKAWHKGLINLDGATSIDEIAHLE